MSDPVLKAVEVVKVLGEGAGQVRALDGVNFDLHGGELTLLMGPSGSGKTTLLSILGCMLTPTDGTVLIHDDSTQGKHPEELAKLRRDNIGFVFQSYHLFPTLTAIDNVRIVLDVRGEPADRSIDRAREALKTVGLAHKERSYPRELSGGEQQRVAIARAIVGDARAILADEPTAALDSQNGNAIMSVLAQIAQDPARGVLVVTHDPRILPFADRIIRIEDGKIVSEERRKPAIRELQGLSERRGAVKPQERELDTASSEQSAARSSKKQARL